MGIRVLAYRVAGYACLAISVACIPVGTSPGARAQCYAAARDAVRQIAAVVAPSPPPAKKRRGLFGSGPIVVRANGGVDVGTHRQSQNAVTHATSTSGVTLNLGIERRTERTSLSLQQGMSYVTGATSLAQASMAYQTPRYGLDYGPLSGGGEIGQLQLGAFTRGLRASFPRGGHTLEVLGAAALTGDGTGYRVGGLRYTRFGTRSTATLTALHATTQSGGTDNVVGAALRRQFRGGSALLEAGWSSTAGVPGTSDGARFALALTADRAGERGFGQLRAAYEPNGFVGLNAVTLGQRSLDLTERSIVGPASVGVSAGISNAVGGTATRRLALDFAEAGKRLSFSTQASLASSSGAGAATVVRGGGFTLSSNLRGLSLSASGTIAATASTGGNELDRAVSVNASQAFGSSYLQYTHGIGASASGEAPSNFSEDQLTFVRPIGRKLDLSVAAIHTVQNSSGGHSVTSTLSLGVVRRLSPSLSVRAAYNLDTTAGSGASHGSALAIDLVGPLALGADRTSGRAIPGAPAVIRGRVYLASGSDVPGATQQRGIGDVLVLLDGTRVQRTDATGQYEFRPVTAGTHQVTIEPASVGPGLTADRLGDAFTIGGGQTRTVDFGIGRFAGVSGEVRIKRGDEYQPIPNVQVVVDDLYRSTTGPDGHFSIGRLNPGTHRVAIGSETLRSDIAFDGPTQRSVSIPAGTYVPVAFTALPLGSIGGRVVLLDESDPAPRGAENVYVVADPGDHAVITDNDGAFILDNLPAGMYTLHLDDQTTPDGYTLEQPLSITLAASQRVTDAVLQLTPEKKTAVMTFDAGKRAAVIVTVNPPRVPPGGATHVSVHAAVKGTRGVIVASAALGDISLHSEGRDLWGGLITIPQSATPGEILLRAELTGAKGAGDAAIVVDTHIPLVGVRLFPTHPKPGTLVRALVRIAAPSNGRDELITTDGQHIRTRSFSHGLATYDVRVPGRGLPLDATIRTSDGRSYAFTLR